MAQGEPGETSPAPRYSRPYLTVISVNRRHRYFDTRRRWRRRTIKLPGLLLIVTSYKKAHD